MDPFGRVILQRIFKKDKSGNIAGRESSQIEYKENFSLASLTDYTKDMAAFSNNKGGYIVFGVQNSPHTPKGLTSETFNKLDPAKFTEGINSIFSPSIRWDKFLFETGSIKFGIIYIHKAEFKPVMATKNDGTIKSGEIYYRYGGRSEKIMYAELRNILEERITLERKTLMNQMQKLVTIGPENVAVVDLLSGNLNGAHGTIVIDKKLIQKIKFIKEGQFKKNGTPTLKLIGDVKPVDILPARNNKIVKVRLSDDQNAQPVKISEDDALKLYPLSYKDLCIKLTKRYPNFKIDKRFHTSLKIIRENQRFAIKRLLDPNNPKSSSKIFYSPAIIKEFKSIYTKATRTG